MTSLYCREESELRLERSLYPAVPPHERGYLRVDSGHSIYFEEAGRRDGLPVVVLHGGPGSGTSPIARRFLDPAFYRIISFDQRGAGRSQPSGCLEANTTAHLISDMEMLRQDLAISSWIVCGGSWGATLALAYGISHPMRCLGFLLRSVALGRQPEYRWWTTGMKHFFPESWYRFANHVCEAERDDLIAAYGKRLASEDERISGAAAVEWHRYEGACGSLFPRQSRKLENATTAALIHMARIEAHYFLHNGFLTENWILDHKGQIAHLPASIVHGRYDVVCPPMNAYELADGWPLASLRIVNASGHSPTEYLLAEAFLEEAERAKGWPAAASAASSA